MIINFTKATASGNDFVMIDSRQGKFDFDYSLFVQIACNRRFGIGADGVIFVETDSATDFLMRYFNADGSEGSLCGNGARSTAKFMSNKLQKQSVRFKAVGKVYSAEIFDESVKLYLPDLTKNISDYNFPIDGNNIHAFFIDTGSPHIIVFEKDFPYVAELENLNVFDLGRKIRYHELLSPAGANINFVKKIDKATVKIRTYERGVEDETLACGTGSIASALLSSEFSAVANPVNVLTQGGDKFVVDFKLQNGIYENLSLEGVAVMVFDGEFRYDKNNNTIRTAGN